MELDDEVCLCFHVTKRKLINYIKVERPSRASELANCFGAGTGCGWCRIYLAKLFQAVRTKTEDAGQPTLEEPDTQGYAAGRKGYIAEGKGKPPPGAG